MYRWNHVIELIYQALARAKTISTEELLDGEKGYGMVKILNGNLGSRKLKDFFEQISGRLGGQRIQFKRESRVEVSEYQKSAPFIRSKQTHQLVK